MPPFVQLNKQQSLPDADLNLGATLPLPALHGPLAPCHT